MARVILQNVEHRIIEVEPKLSMVEKYLLMRAHPRSIFTDIVGLIWFLYFTWNHNWTAALLVFTIFRIVALALVWKVNIELLSKTVVGKIALLHIHPINLIIQLTGFIIFLNGIWQHTLYLILVGISIILLGHLFGWANVDPCLDDNKEASFI